MQKAYFVLLLLGAIVAFVYMQNSSTEGVGAEQKKTSNSEDDLRSGQRFRTALPEQESQRALRDRRLAQLETELDAESKKLAELTASLSPDQQQRLLDLTMRQREPKYRQFLKEMGVGESQSASVIGIVRSRESELSKHRLAFLHSRDAITYQKERLISTTASEVQLLELLDEDQYDKLVKFEDGLRKQSIADLKD